MSEVHHTTAFVAPLDNGSDMSRPLDAIVICGPSGVGKGTMLGRLFSQYPDRFAFSVSHTTRAARPNEVDGREYHFVSRETILAMRDNDEFLELCEVHGNYYGTSVQAVKAVQGNGRTCVIEIDVQGAQKLAARAVKARIPLGNNTNKLNSTTTVLNATYFFITAPKKELRKRIIGRGCDGEDLLQRRLATAETEYAFQQRHPEFFSVVVVNDILDEAYGRLLEGINLVFGNHHMPALE